MRACYSSKRNAWTNFQLKYAKYKPSNGGWGSYALYKWYAHRGSCKTYTFSSCVREVSAFAKGNF